MVLRHFAFCKTAEVFMMGQQCGRLVHPIQVWSLVLSPGNIFQEYLLPEVDIIAVFAATCLEARMEIGRNCFQVQCRYIGRKQTVEPVQECFRQSAGAVEMEGKMPRMNAAVRTTATGNLNFMAQQYLQFGFKYALNRWFIQLLLPTLVSGSTELDIESVTLQFHEMLPESEAFVDDGSTLAHTDAHGCHTVARLFALQQVQQGG